MRKVYRAAPESVRHARRAVSAFARKIGGNPEEVRAISLAVSEASSNVVDHAYHGRISPGEMVVLASLTGRHLKVQVIDHGVGLAPRFDSPGIGLGLPLLSQLSDKFEVCTSEGGGTEICMQFRLTGLRSIEAERLSDVALPSGQTDEFVV